jgi:hypothetical protein
MGITIINFCTIIDNRKNPNNLINDEKDTIKPHWPLTLEGTMPTLHLHQDWMQLVIQWVNENKENDDDIVTKKRGSPKYAYALTSNENFIIEYLVHQHNKMKTHN